MWKSIKTFLVSRLSLQAKIECFLLIFVIFHLFKIKWLILVENNALLLVWSSSVEWMLAHQDSDSSHKATVSSASHQNQPTPWWTSCHLPHIHYSHPLQPTRLRTSECHSQYSFQIELAESCSTECLVETSRWHVCLDHSDQTNRMSPSKWTETSALHRSDHASERRKVTDEFAEHSHHR